VVGWFRGGWRSARQRPEPATVHSMSTRQPTSWALRFFVPGYLVVIGVGLIVGAVLVALYLPDEWFVTLMAAVGGATMLLTTGALLTVAWDR
jgi:hypothetical protein